MRIDNILGDNIAYTELVDLSTANLSHESRVAAISRIATISHGGSESKNPEALYKRLTIESNGGPSSVFEFIPVLLLKEHLERLSHYTEKYGEWVENGNYLLTNLRALMKDDMEFATTFFNTPEECAIIAKHHRVFKHKVPLFIRSQMIRHRVSWVEMSRRYVNGNKVGFEFYVKDSLDKADKYAIREHKNLAISLYNKLVSNGVHPQDARAVLPQSMYTELFSAWYPSQLENFYAIRDDSHAQEEIRLVAQSMKELQKED